jgi:ABC-2 type transport system permease protein
MRAIFWKELADHFGRRRFALLVAMVVMGGLWGLSIMLREVQVGASSADEFLFLQVFHRSSGVLPSLLFFVSIFGPLVGISLGFDAINGERTQGTLSRVLAQPVYRDAVFNGKFLAGLVTVAVVFISMIIVVVGLGMVVMGYAPSGEEVLRITGFGIVAVAYLALWLALAMTCSIFLRNTVASALVALSIWLFSTFFIQLIGAAVANLFVPDIATGADALSHARIDQWISRISPFTLFSEATNTVLDPAVRSLSLLVREQLADLLPTPISAAQSLRLVWPHIVGLFSAVVVLLGLSYVKFMREEIRS